jgi:hypothetical protein
MKNKLGKHIKNVIENSFSSTTSILENVLKERDKLNNGPSSSTFI